MDEFQHQRTELVALPPSPGGAATRVLYEGCREMSWFRSTQVSITTRAIEIDISGADPFMSLLTLGCWFMFFQFDYVERYPLDRVTSLELVRHGGGGGSGGNGCGKLLGELCRSGSSTVIRGTVQGRRRGILSCCCSQAAARTFEVRIAAVGSAEDVEELFDKLQEARRAAIAKAEEDKRLGIVRLEGDPGYRRRGNNGHGSGARRKDSGESVLYDSDYVPSTDSDEESLDGSSDGGGGSSSDYGSEGDRFVRSKDQHIV